MLILYMYLDVTLQLVHLIFICTRSVLKINEQQLVRYYFASFQSIKLILHSQEEPLVSI